MWWPGERRADDCKFAFYLSRGPDFRKRTGDLSPPGEVLSKDGKYPKILGPAGPNPGRTFGKRSKFVRRGHEFGAAAFSARCRSCRSTQVTPLFSQCAARVPCLLGSIGGRPDEGIGPYMMHRTNGIPRRGGCPHPPAGRPEFLRIY